MIKSESKPGLRDERPEIRRLSHDTAMTEPWHSHSYQSTNSLTSQMVTLILNHKFFVVAGNNSNALHRRQDLASLFG